MDRRIESQTDPPPGRREIVRRIDVAAAPAAAAAGEAALRSWRAEHLAVPGTARLRFDALPSDDDAGEQMARRVALDPGDAGVHVARVNHCLLQGDADGVYGALVDLSLAFGATGAGLRARLLHGAAALLTAERAAALELAAAGGLSPRTPLPACGRSMLGRGVSGCTDIVRAHERAEADG